MKIDYSREIHLYLMKNKIKNSKIGYMYLVTAIEIGLRSLENIYYAMKLYEMIAEKYNANVCSVERAIRTVIQPTGLTSKEFISFAVYNIMYGSGSEDYTVQAGSGDEMTNHA